MARALRSSVARPARRDERGTLTGIFDVNLDLSEQKRAEGELRAMNTRLEERTAELEAIFASMPDAVYVGNENGITRCNQVALDNLGGRDIQELQDQIPVLNEKLQNRYADTGERIRPEDEAFARALRGQPWTYEVISRNLTTGLDIVQRCAANPILRDGQIIGAVAINTDITAQKRTEQALREAVRELSRRETELAEMAEGLRQAHDELERRVQDRTAQLEAEITRRQEITQQLRALSRRLVQVQEDERRSLSRDLHDTSAQAMSALKIGLVMLKREADCIGTMYSHIDELSQIADTVAEDLHRLSINLRPSTLDRHGLVPALKELIRSVGERTGIDIGLLVLGMDERLPGDKETALYRIVQEGCTNIARYAKAAHASVSVQREGDTLRLVVEDDGEGFDVAEALNRGRLGLVGMPRKGGDVGRRVYD